MEPRDMTLDRLRTEVAGLRRQSTDAATASSRLSSQLAEVQEEVIKTREALKQAEVRFVEEKKFREEAERALQLEARKREALEAKLEAYHLQRQRSPPAN